ncbi:hypothetical protein CBF23_013195 [Marinomonas agarivorans]|nr:hypothetical protein CBF23_013195 [Marinomonas agarivorans]
MPQKLAVKKPTVTIAKTEITKLSTESITLRVGLKINNANPFALKTAGFDLELITNQRAVANIQQPDSTLTIPAQSGKLVYLPVTLKSKDMIKSLSDLSNQTEVEYTIQGQVNLQLPVIGNLARPVSFSGTLPIPQMPKVKLQQLTLKSANLKRAKIELTLQVKNPNVFGVKLNRLSYQFKAEDKTLGEGSAIPTVIRPQNTAKLTIPLTINLSVLGHRVYSAFLKREFPPVAVTFDADVLPQVKGGEVTRFHFASEQNIAYK